MDNKQERLDLIKNQVPCDPDEKMKCNKEQKKIEFGKKDGYSILPKN